MSELLPSDIINLSSFNKRNELFFKFFNRFVSFKKVKRIYEEHSRKEGLDFVEAVLNELNFKVDISESDLKKIPTSGSFAIVSNFPWGGIEALVLIKVLSSIRDDFKIVVRSRFHELPPMKSLTLPLYDSQNKTDKLSINSAKQILEHLKNEKPLIFFPAIGPGTIKRKTNTVIDNQWNPNLLRLIKIAEIPVIPVFFNNSFSKIYHLLGNFNPILQSFVVQKELMKKKNSEINFKIGSAIKVSEQANFKNIWEYTRFLRARTYVLNASSPVDINKFFKYRKKFRLSKAEQIAPPVDINIIIKEINKAKENYLINSQGEFDIICAPYTVMPNVMIEIGRLREIAFREVGEGTNKSLDIDEFDLYYWHLIIWDKGNKKIAGAYRMGLGDEILDSYAKDGFYISTLFKIKKGLAPVLCESIEMGRSFIIKEYQRKPLSLFLLWKGILYFLLKNPQYRYLIGPVSISHKFTELSKSLIVQFFQKYYFSVETAKYIKPRKKYKITLDEFDKQILLDSIGDNINKLDKYIREIEPDSGRMPVLFKKYFGLGAKLMAFNVDPKFNNCLDGLIILDIFNVPEDIIRTFAKELDDESLLERFDFSFTK